MHASLILSSVVSGLYIVTFIVCVIFGPAKGQPTRKANAHYIFLYLLYMAALALASSLTSWEYNNHVDMIRLMKSFVLIGSLTVIMTNVINGFSLYMLIHIQNLVLSTIFLFMSLDADTTNKRVTWLVIYAVASCVRLFYLLRESLHVFTYNPKFTKHLAGYIIVYDVAYFVATIISPYFQELISVDAYRLVMDSVDVATTILCTFPIVHYSWSTVHHTRTMITENQITAAIDAGTLTDEDVWHAFHTFTASS